MGLQGISTFVPSWLHVKATENLTRRGAPADHGKEPKDRRTMAGPRPALELLQELHVGRERVGNDAEFELSGKLHVVPIVSVEKSSSIII